MELIEIKSKNILKDIYYLIVNQHHCAAWCIQDEKIVLVPKAKAVDEALCFKMGYNIYEAFYLGGVIVVSEGDIAFAHFGKPENDFAVQFSNNFVKWLKSKGLNAELLDNDILVDGYKVCGMVVTRHFNIDYFAAHIGINTNLEDIKKICTKQMNKVPKGLGDYGINGEMIKEWFCKFVEELED